MNLFELVGTLAISGAAKAQSDIDTTSSKASKAGENFKKGITTVAKWGAAIGTAAVTGATALVNFAKSSAETADNVDKMSQKIGISRQAYQELDFICSQSGTTVDGLQAGMKTLTAAMDKAASGTAANVEQFANLGVSVTNADGSLRSQEEVLFEVMASLQNMENQTEKARLATELFGRSGTELMPLLNGASGSIEEMKEQAHELGLVLDDEAVDSGVALTDTMDQLKRAFGAVLTKLGAKLMPYIQKFCDLLIKNMPTIQGIIDQLAPTILGFMDEMLPILMDLVSKLLPVAVDLIKSLIPIITKIASEILPIFVNIITELLPIIQQIFPIIMKIVDMILPIFVELLNLILPIIVDLLDALLPIVDAILTPLLELLAPIMELLKPIFELIGSLIKPLVQLLGAILTPLINVISTILGLIIDLLQPIIKWLADFFSKVLNKAIAAIMPIIEKVGQFFTDAFSSIKDNWSGIGDFFKGLWEKIKGAFSAVGTFFKTIFTNAWESIKKIFSKVGEFFQGIWDGLKTGLKAMLNGVIWFVNKAIDGINLILTPIRKVIQTVGNMFGAGLSMDDVSIPHIPQLEQGGVLKKGQVGFLEGNGDEAVVPLEKNTGWIDKVAEKINGSASNNDVIKKLDELIKAITSMNIVLDTGLMVGEMTPALDTSLGNLYAAKGRGRA